MCRQNIYIFFIKVEKICMLSLIVLMQMKNIVPVVKYNWNRIQKIVLSMMYAIFTLNIFHVHCLFASFVQIAFRLFLLQHVR